MAAGVPHKPTKHHTNSNIKKSLTLTYL